MVASCSPPRLIDTALSEMSNSPVTFAPGALARSQALKSLRSADRFARYDCTVALSKSIFLPLGGFVFAEVASGSPFSCTRAVVLSWTGRDVGPSEGAPTAAEESAKSESKAMDAIGRNEFTCPPLELRRFLQLPVCWVEHLASLIEPGRAPFKGERRWRQ